MSFRPTLLLLVLLAPASLAQAPPDSAFLPEDIEATGDTAEVRALREWAVEHQNSHPEQAERVARRALVLARELDDGQGTGLSLLILGNLASPLSEKEEYYTAAWEAFEQAGDERHMGHSGLKMGDVYLRREQLQQALDAYFEALDSYKRIDDTEGQAKAIANIGFVHLGFLFAGQDNREEAMEYVERATALAETVDDRSLLVHILNYSGVAFTEQGAYKKAESHLLRALDIAEEHGYKRPTAAVSNNLGHLYNRWERYERSLPYLLTAKRLGEELEDIGLLIPVYGTLGTTYLNLNRYDEARHYAHKSLTLAEQAETFFRRMEAHRSLSEIYEAAGNLEQALNHHRQYATARDSFLTEQKNQSIAELQTRYETEEKQRANKRLQQENQIQALQLTLLLAGMGGLLLVLGVLFYRYRLKKKANRLLEDVDAAKSHFFANISHEFRTPLTVIIGSVQDALAGRFEGDKKKLTEQHRAILRNSRQLQRLVDEVLDLNRLEAGKLELHPAPGDLVRTLRRLVEADAPLAERHGIDLTFEHDVEHSPRLYDPEKLEKIVGNLLSNALKFTPEGGSVQVKLRCGNETEISVSDTGPGIPAEMQENVFERFAQVEDGSLHGGTGIGLALAKELAELHGGTITLESEPGEGSTFTVRLPLEETTLDDVPKTAPQGRVGGVSIPKEELEIGGDGESPSPTGRGGRGEGLDRTTVLIIEDNADVRAYVRRSLEETYRVLEAADGETGLQQARAELPDLIVSDIMLPGIDGYEVARRLKVEGDTECIPVVMLTARAAEEDQTEGYGSGAEIYITKPFSPETLRAACARLLEERHRLRRRLQEEGSQMEEMERENGQPTLAEHARAAVLENLHNEDFGVEELASALHMTRFTLYHRFKAEVGVTPNAFVRALRMERARELLAGGAGSVSEVAYAVGYNSLSVFSRNYRKHYGAPPSTHLARSGTN